MKPIGSTGTRNLGGTHPSVARRQPKTTLAPAHGAGDDTSPAEPEPDIHMTAAQWRAHIRELGQESARLALGHLAERDAEWAKRDAAWALREAELQGELRALREKDAAPRVREILRDAKDRIIGVLDRPRPVTVEERAQRVIDAIEATSEAVDLRSAALDALVAGDPARAMLLAWSAAERVMDAHEDVLEEVVPAGLRAYLWSQVQGLATGELAELALRPPVD